MRAKVLVVEAMLRQQDTDAAVEYVHELGRTYPDVPVAQPPSLGFVPRILRWRG